MLIAAFVCLVLASIAFNLAFMHTQNTVSLLAKMLFYFFIITFFLLIIGNIMNTAPPIAPAHESNRPL